MPFLLKEPLGKANEFNPVRFSGRAGDQGWLVTAPVAACGRLKLACLIKKVETARLTTCKTGDSSLGMGGKQGHRQRACVFLR
jgi:hypothetical protein